MMIAVGGQDGMQGDVQSRVEIAKSAFRKKCFLRLKVATFFSRQLSMKLSVSIITL